MMIKWAEEDLLFLSPLITLTCMVVGFRWLDRKARRLSKPEYEVKFFQNAAPPQRTAVDWATLISNVLNNATKDGFIVLADEDGDRLIVAGRSSDSVYVNAKPDGTGWETRS